MQFARNVLKRLSDIKKRVMRPAFSALAVFRVVSRGLGTRVTTARQSSFETFDYILCSIYTYRIPLLVALFSFWLLSQPAQVRELYVLSTGDSAGHWVRSLTYLVILPSALSLNLLMMADVSSRYFPRGTSSREFRTVDTFIKLVCSLLPIMGVQLGLSVISTEPFNQSLLDFSRLFQWLSQRYPDEPELVVFAPALFADWMEHPAFRNPQLLAASLINLGQIILFLTPYPRRLARRLFMRYIELSWSLASSSLYRGVITANVALFLVFVAPALWFLPGEIAEIPRWIGAVAIVFIFLSLIVWHLTALSEFAERSGYPALGLLVALALVLSYLDLNDNHAVRTNLISPRAWVSTDEDPRRGDLVDATGRIDFNKVNRIVRGGKYYYESGVEPDLPSLGEAFTRWLAARPPEVKQRFSSRPYPLYIVTAEGGGIYAAAQSAIFLARLADRCPTIVNHIFAISAVSGGSLGAAIFSALIERKYDELAQSAVGYFSSCPGTIESGEGWFEREAKKLLAEDHLSPSLAAWLFPDFLQRFLPFSVELFDRARALERSFEQSWNKRFAGEKNPFARGFRQHWSASGFVPMLLLNATVVEKGTQTIIAPVGKWGGDSFFEDISARYDIPLSTAVGLSARFTMIAPAGRHVDRDGPGGSIFRRSHRLVDGGYVENSGAETALTAVLSLEAQLQQLRTSSSPESHSDFEVRIFVIGGSGATYLAPQGLNELASPVAAMYNSRIHRTSRAIRDIQQFMDAGPVAISWKHFSPPLGWVISPFTIEKIGAHIGAAERCTGAPVEQAERESFASRARSFAGRGDIFADPEQDGYTNSLELWHQLRHNHCSACSLIRRAEGKNIRSRSAEENAAYVPFGWYVHDVSCEGTRNQGDKDSSK